MSKPNKQVAALPLRLDENGRIRVLLITSRETRRWVVPKGWPMEGKKSWRAAEIEAMEEAGAKGHMAREIIGTYDYKKRLSNGKHIKCRVRVFPMHVRTLMKRWPERLERRRKWVSPKRAAKMVKEPELSEILTALHKAEPKGVEFHPIGKKKIELRTS